MPRHRNTKIPAGENLTIGLDLGDRRHHVCVLDAAGEILADPKHFEHARDVGPYLGLVPRRDQSGQTDKQLGITKATALWRQREPHHSTR